MPTTLRDEIKQHKAFPSREVETYLNLMRTSALLQHHVNRFLKDHGITDIQYNALRILIGAGPNGLTCAEVGERMVTPGPDITRLLDRLVKSGLVERCRSVEDRRIVIVRITPAGVDLADRLAPELTRLNHQIIGHLPDTDLATLNTLLTRLRHPGEG